MKTFLEEVNEKINGVPIQRCYHCRKCTAGCPMAVAMEHNPNRVVKMIQMEKREEVLASGTIWLCVSCETCITRCPNEVDIARMMDVLRQMAIETGVGAKEKKHPQIPRGLSCQHPDGRADQRTYDDGPLQAQIGGSVLRYGHGDRHVPQGQALSGLPADKGYEERAPHLRKDAAVVTYEWF